MPRQFLLLFWLPLIAVSCASSPTKISGFRVLTLPDNRIQIGSFVRPMNSEEIRVVSAANRALTNVNNNPVVTGIQQITRDYLEKRKAAIAASLTTYLQAKSALSSEQHLEVSIGNAERRDSPSDGDLEDSLMDLKGTRFANHVTRIVDPGPASHRWLGVVTGIIVGDLNYSVVDEKGKSVSLSTPEIANAQALLQARGYTVKADSIHATNVVVAYKYDVDMATRLYWYYKR